MSEAQIIAEIVAESNNPMLPALMAPKPPARSAHAEIEIERAVTEVKAAVMAAKACPRDLTQFQHDLLESCKNPEFAEAAFYSLPRGGGKKVRGKSIQLALEVARLWGNNEYGIVELDKTDKQTEFLTYHVDWERNSRSVRKFIAPHTRTRKENDKHVVVDITDGAGQREAAYSLASRHFRNCIFDKIPQYYLLMAEKQCDATLAMVPDIAKAVANSVAFFQEKFGVTVKQLEDYLEKPRSMFGQPELVELKRVAIAVRNGEDIKEFFAAPEIQAPPAKQKEKAKAAAKKPETETKVEAPKQQESPESVQDSAVSRTVAEENTAPATASATSGQDLAVNGGEAKKNASAQPAETTTTQQAGGTSAEPAQTVSISQDQENTDNEPWGDLL